MRLFTRETTDIYTTQNSTTKNMHRLFNKRASRPRLGLRLQRRCQLFKLPNLKYNLTIQTFLYEIKHPRLKFSFLNCLRAPTHFKLNKYVAYRKATILPLYYAIAWL